MTRARSAKALEPTARQKALAFELETGVRPSVPRRKLRAAPGRAPLEVIDSACSEIERIAGSYTIENITKVGRYPSELLTLAARIRAARGELLMAAVVAAACEDDVPPELLPRPLAWVRE